MNTIFTAEAVLSNIPSPKVGAHFIFTTKYQYIYPVGNVDITVITPNIIYRSTTIFLT